jgi:hypothetical protein
MLYKWLIIDISNGMQHSPGFDRSQRVCFDLHRTHGGPNGFIEAVDPVDETADDDGAVASTLASVFSAIGNNFSFGCAHKRSRGLYL